MGSNMNIGAAETTGADLNSIAGEFDSAFLDLQKDPTNNGRLMDLVDTYHRNSLNAPKFCSALHVNDPFFFRNFFVYLRCLCMDHSKLMETLGPMDDGFSKHLFWLDFFKKSLSVLSTTAAAFCLAAVIYAVNAVPKRVPEGAAAAAAAFLIPALAKWGHSVLKKRESTVKKHKKVTALLIMGARLGIEHLGRICGLELATTIASVSETAPSSETGYLSETTSLSETVDDVEKATAVKTNVEELLGKVEDYSGEMKRIKKEVVKSIIEHLG